MTNFLRSIRDYIWPLPSPLPQKYKNEKAKDLAEKLQSIPNDESTLTEWKNTYGEFLKAEDERRQSAEGRLTNAMGLASIAGTIVFGTILAQIAGTVRLQPGLPRWTVGICSLYLVMQICSSIYAAVGGLARQNYLALTPTDFLTPKEDKNAQLRGVVTAQLKTLDNHQSHNDAKITWMATAHRAMQQFLFGLLIFAVIGTFLAINAPPAPDDLVQTLKRNHELQELLRGPVGPSGPTGVKGEPCNTGANNARTPDNEKKGTHR